MQRAVHRAQRAADAPAQQRQLLLAGGPQRLAYRPVQLVAHELGEPHVGVLFIGDAPIDEEHVEPLLEQELDERAARPEVEDLRPVDQREHEQNRDRVLPSVRAISVERRPAVRPDDVARRLTDRGVGDGQDDVRQLERRRRHAGQRPDRAHDGVPVGIGASVPLPRDSRTDCARDPRTDCARALRADGARGLWVDGGAEARRAAPPPPATGAPACPRFDAAAGRAASRPPARRGAGSAARDRRNPSRSV